MSDEQPEITEHDEELIEQGRELVQRMDSAQLRVGKLALEFAPMGERGYRSGAGERAAIYADRVGLLASTLKVYRATAHAWSVTDVGDDEFSFSVLQTLAAVGRKEELLAKLRETDPPEGKKRWGATDALAYAQQEGFIASTSSAVSPEERRQIANGETPVRTVASGTGGGQYNGPRDTPRPINLSFVGETLRKMSFKNLDPAEREELDPQLAKVEAEAARLRSELSALAESDTQVHGGVPVKRSARKRAAA